MFAQHFSCTNINVCNGMVQHVLIGISVKFILKNSIKYV